MLGPRFTQQSARLLLAHRPTSLAFTRIATPAIATHKPRISSRPAATTTVKDTTAHSILERQRLNRPVSPHLSIYRPQITWYGSITNRLTGAVLSGGFYIFGAAYLVSPAFGWHLDSVSMAAAFGSLSPAAKLMIKFGVAWPFAYHSFGGVRHLVWDTGRELDNKSVQRTGWAVVGASVVTAGGLALVGGG